MSIADLLFAALQLAGNCRFNPALLMPPPSICARYKLPSRRSFGGDALLAAVPRVLGAYLLDASVAASLSADHEGYLHRAVESKV
jgi:hypothetical protein